MYYTLSTFGGDNFLFLRIVTVFIEGVEKWISREIAVWFRFYFVWESGLKLWISWWISIVETVDNSSNQLIA